MPPINFHCKETYTLQNILQNDIYQIIKLELGYFCEDLYEDLMDHYALAKTALETEYYENYSQVVRRLKTAFLNPAKINLQEHIANKKEKLKDSIVSPKQQKQRTISYDILDKWNQSVLQLVYDIMEEVNSNVLKKDSCYEIVEKYFDLPIKKRFNNLEEFINKNYELLDKSVHLVYGGYYYGKKY